MQPIRQRKFLVIMRIVLFLSWFIPIQLLAQGNMVSNSNVYLQSMLQTEKLSDMHLAVEVPVYAEDKETFIKEFLLKSLPALSQEGMDLKLDYMKVTATGTHFQFKQYCNGVEVYWGYVKVHLNPQHVLYDITNHLIDLHKISPLPSATSSLPTYYLLAGNQLVSIYKKGHDLYDAQNNLIRSIDPKFYNTVDDTLVNGKVFNHDPLTVRGVIYGQDGTNQHYNDSDYALLNDQRILVTFPATIDSGYFRLKSTYAVIQDLDAPNNLPVKSPTPMFDFTRKTSAFKEVMAYYHVLHTRAYFMSLGFTNRMQYQQRIDALSGYNDNSYFNPDDTTLNFGMGGIPDAEDADVPAHEYTHAMSFDISPTPNMATERRAMEEGICDVTSAVQSYKTTPFNWRLIYNFDGPNPVAQGFSWFWGGRNGQSTKTYLNSVGNPYKDCEIWTSTMLDIAEHSTIGHDTLMIIMLNSIAHMTQSSTMPEGAQYMIEVDSILFGGRHKLIMGYYFNRRELGTFMEGIETIADMPNSFQLINSAGFASGESDAIIQHTTSGKYELSIIDINGREVLNKEVKQYQYKIEGNNFKPGMYFLQFKEAGFVYTQKLLKY